MNYLELLRCASPEALVTFTSLLVLTLGLTTARANSFNAFVAALGLVLAVIAILKLPAHAYI
jgi:hypothetical protein